jgi:hypothetical protein
MNYIDDEGFTQRVLEKLPPRRRQADRWRLRVTLGALALSGVLCLALAQPLSGLFEEIGLGLLALIAAGGVLLLALDDPRPLTTDG